MTLMCERLPLIQAARVGPMDERIYLQGEVSFKLPKEHVPIRVYCSPHNEGATALVDELNLWFSNAEEGVPFLEMVDVR